MSSPPRARGRRRAALGAALLLLALGLAVPALLRERVRRSVEARLEETLGGRARVGAIELLRPRSLVLRDVRVRDPSRVPLLAALRAERVSLGAPSLRAALRGEQDEAIVEGLELVARGAPAGEGGAVPAEPAATAREAAWPEGRLVVREGVLRFPSASGANRLRFAAELRSDAGGPEGELRLSAARLALAPVLAVVPPGLPELARPLADSVLLTGISGRARVEADGAELELAATAGALGLGAAWRTLGATSALLRLGFDGAGRLELEAGAPWADRLGLLAERRPASGWELLRAEASGVDARTLPSLDERLSAWTLSGTSDWTWSGESGGLALEARLGEARGAWPAGSLEAQGLRLSLQASPAGAGAVRIRELGVSAERASWRASGGLERLSGEGLRLRAEASLRAGERLAWSELAASLEGLTLATGEGLEAAAEGLELSSSAGRLDLDGDGAFSLEAKGAARSFAISEGGRRLEPTALSSAELRAERGAGAATTTLELDARSGDGLGRFRMTGKLGPELDLAWSWRDAEPERVLDLLSPPGPRRLRAEALSARGRLEGDAAAPRWRLTLGGRRLRWSPAEGLLLESPLASAELSGPAPGGRIAWRLPRFQAVARAEESEAEVPVAVEADGAWAPELGRGGLLVEAFELDAGELGRALGRGDRGGSGGRFRVEAAELEPWSALLAESLPDRWPERVEGRIEGRFEWTVAADGWLRLDGDLLLSDAGFEDAGATRILRGAGADIHTTAAWDPRSGALEWTAASDDLGGFELAWGSLYGDWSARRAAARWRLQRTGPEGSGLSWQLELLPGPASRIELRRPPGSEELQLRASFDELARTWSDWVATPLQGTGLGDGARLSGSAELRLDARVASEGRELEGLLRFEGLGLSHRPIGLALEGLDGRLPFVLRWRGSAVDGEGSAVAGESAAGRLAFDRLRLGELIFAPFDSAVTIRGDSLAFEEPLESTWLDGGIELRGLQASSLLGAEPRLSASVALHGVDLGAAARAWGLPPLEGRLEASYPEAELGREELVLRGEAAAELFGGTLRWGEIRVREPLGPVPRTSLDLRADGIDLARLTSRLGFGLVTGRVDGRIDDLVFEGSMPVGFFARFRTVPQRGLPQTVSVEAAENITALGSGSKGKVFDRGLLRFFDHYRYHRAGFEAELHHGVVHLRGTEERGERELFVKGRAPLRLDVVNADPGRALSFAGLLERVKNLNLEDVRIERGPPAEAKRSER